MNWISLTEKVMLEIRKEFTNLIMNIITIILFPCVIKQLSSFLCLATLNSVLLFADVLFAEPCCSRIRIETLPLT